MATFILQILAVCEANYPEATKQAFMINCKEFGKALTLCILEYCPSVYTVPSIFPMCFNLFKSVLREETRAKIHMLGGMQIQWNL